MNSKLPKYLLLYDEDCPVCKLYARFFAYLGILPKESFLPWHRGIEMPELNFDHKLSMDKIALIDTESNTNLYGVDSILEVISLKTKWIKTIGKTTIIYFLLTKLYDFIALNRKIIAAIDCSDRCPCNPRKGYSQRIVLVLISAFVVNYATSIYFSENLKAYFIGNKAYGDYLFFFGQIGFQFIAFKILKEKDFYNYAGHVSFVSFLGAVLLLVFHFGLQFIQYIGMEIDMLNPLCYGIVFSFMFYEHSRRLSIEKMTQWLSLTWFIYRLVIYPFAFKI